MVIRRCHSTDAPGWLELRRALWPEGSECEHRKEMAFMCATPERFAAFLAEPALGLVEVAVRADYVNGTESSPVGFRRGTVRNPQ